ncbi:MAG: type I-E CRISPR-associated endonuclease Cas1e [Bacteroidota bacterium]|nr:type I-E CRISPR-associated endonuclease Cas1e [Bacteroidota bacterium]
MLRGRLGLETARIPHADRHGLLWLSHGTIAVQAGTVSFERKIAKQGSDDPEPGRYSIPFQTLSTIIMGPGTSVTHDALRLLARHGTALVAAGKDGVRCYTAPPIMRDQSDLARRQVTAWADAGMRLAVARRMYEIRMGRTIDGKDINALRGMEGARMRESYRLHAQKAGIQWSGRWYDRANPVAADVPNQAINHASTAVQAAAAIAVTATATIPQLGFIHEDSGQSFVLDIADLYRDSVTIPVAFAAARKVLQSSSTQSVERTTRKDCGSEFRKRRVIPMMIDTIKGLFPASAQE